MRKGHRIFRGLAAVVALLCILLPCFSAGMSRADGLEQEDGRTRKSVRRLCAHPLENTIEKHSDRSFAWAAAKRTNGRSFFLLQRQTALVFFRFADVAGLLLSIWERFFVYLTSSCLVMRRYLREWRIRQRKDGKRRAAKEKRGCESIKQLREYDILRARTA